jgi:hypothetical protein
MMSVWHQVGSVYPHPQRLRSSVHARRVKTLRWRVVPEQLPKVSVTSSTDESVKTACVCFAYVVMPPVRVLTSPLRHVGLYEPTHLTGEFFILGGVPEPAMRHCLENV